MHPLHILFTILKTRFLPFIRLWLIITFHMSDKLQELTQTIINNRVSIKIPSLS